MINRSCWTLAALLTLLSSATALLQPRWAAPARRVAPPSTRIALPLKASAEFMDAISGTSYLLADSKLVQAKEVRQLSHRGILYTNTCACVRFLDICGGDQPLVRTRGGRPYRKRL